MFVFQYGKAKYKEYIRKKYQIILRYLNNAESITEKSTQIWGTEKAPLRHLKNEKEPVMQIFWAEMSKCKGPEAENKCDSFK